MIALTLGALAIYAIWLAMAYVSGEVWGEGGADAIRTLWKPLGQFFLAAYVAALLIYANAAYGMQLAMS